MKRNFMILLAAISIVSCNEIEPEALDNEPALQLDTIVFNDGSEEDIMIFENNKVQEYKIGDDMSYSYVYNEDGQLSQITGTDLQGQIFLQRTITYDEQDRIISKNDIYYNPIHATESVENVVYLYDDVNNTVTADFTSFDNYVEDRIYHFSENGLLSKIVTADNTVLEYQYDGNNIIQKTTGDYGVSYTYDSTMPVKGEFLNIYKNMFKSYKNFIVYNGFTLAETVSDKFMLSSDETAGSNGDMSAIYQFNEFGYPIEVVKNYTNGQSVTITISYN